MSVKLDKDVIIEAVKRYNTLTYNVLAEKLGVHRSSIGRYFNSNPEVLKEAQDVLNNIDKVRFSPDSTTDIEQFERIPIIAEWINILKSKPKPPREAYIRKVLFAVFNTCNALKIHPSKMDLDYVAENVVKWRIAQERFENDKKNNPNINSNDYYPKGCSYNTVRIGLRSFMTIQLGYSAAQLTIKGIGAEHGKGFGQAAKERIELDERKEMIKNMNHAVKQVFKRQKNHVDFNQEEYTLEMYGISLVMYATATRIRATLEMKFNDSKNVFKDNYVELHCVDKGRGGGYHWQKKLIDVHAKFFYKYVEERFGIKNISLLKQFDSFIFPMLQADYGLECAVMKRVQKMSNCYKIVNVNHLFRHTFAQDWLDAMDGNYEVGAELGGWNDIGTMKRCYGAVSEAVINRGLNKAMGLKVEESTHQLRFVDESFDETFMHYLENKGVVE